MNFSLYDRMLGNTKRELVMPGWIEIDWVPILLICRFVY